MKKLLMIACAAVAAFTFTACGDPEVPNGGGDEALTLTINEVCGVSGYKGIELYNYGDQVVKLQGWTILKNDEQAVCWTGTTGEVPAKGFVIIYAKKETGNLPGLDADGKAPAELLSTASFSPSKSLKLDLIDPNGNTVCTFDRGWASNGNTEVGLETLEYSCGRTTDNGDTWAVLDITMGATNNGATNHGAIPTTVPAA